MLVVIYFISPVELVRSRVGFATYASTALPLCLWELRGTLTMVMGRWLLCIQPALVLIMVTPTGLAVTYMQAPSSSWRVTITNGGCLVNYYRGSRVEEVVWRGLDMWVGGEQ